MVSYRVNTGAMLMERLFLLSDYETGYPVWFEITLLNTNNRHKSGK